MATAIARKRKEQIHHTAKNLFRERGYAATSMRHLASELGIEAASLYSHIKSKEEILQLICFEMAEQFLSSTEDLQKKKLSAQELFTQAVTEHIRIITMNMDSSVVFLHEWRHLSEPFLSDFKLMRKRYEIFFKNILAKGEKEKLFKVQNEKLTLFVIFSAMNGIYEWFTPKGKMQPKEIAEQMVEVFLNGILK